MRLRSPDSSLELRKSTFFELALDWPSTLTDAESFSPRQLLEAKIRTLTHTPLIFKPFEAVVAESHQEHLTQISHQLVEISRAAQALNFSVHFNITGYSSVREYAQNGMATSQQRAEAFRDFLTFRGIHPDSIHIKAMGKSPPHGRHHPSLLSRSEYRFE